MCFNSLSPPCGAAGVLHQEREADGPEGDGGASWWPLPYRGDAEQRGEGQGGFASPQWMRLVDWTCDALQTAGCAVELTHGSLACC